MNRLLHESLLHVVFSDDDLKKIVFDELSRINKMYDENCFSLIELYNEKISLNYINSIGDGEVKKLFEVLLLKLSLSDRLPEYSIMERHTEKLKGKIESIISIYPKLREKFNGENIYDAEKITLLVMDNYEYRDKFMKKLFGLDEEKYRIIDYNLKYYDALKSMYKKDEELEPVINKKIKELIDSFGID
ncbi:MAG: hypothetical protein J7K83_01680, partial [Candidatus Aenigmarchaeota archaeon]|nr:hypothetical protein [Candidatus Aenigmarchaeota archaeon]